MTNMITFTVAIAIATLASMTANASGYTSYNSNTELCCNGTILPKGTDDDCCGQQTYAYNTFMCCNEQLIPNNGNANLTCCTDERTGLTVLYDRHTQECCLGKVVDKPDLEVYYECCNDQLYNYATHMCCGNTVLEGKDGQYCCGDELMDYHTHVCCGDTAVEIENGQGCCVDELYDITSKVCCLKWDETNRQYNHNFLDLVGNASRCCNGVAYDPNENICCQDVMLGLPKDLEDSKDAYCCGEVAYDYNNQVCCFGYVKDDETSEYDFKENLFDIVDEVDRCCGYELYDPKTEICCDRSTSEVAELPEDRVEDAVYYMCCGKGLVYNTKSHRCVGDRLVDLSDNWNVCGDDDIDYKTQSCCYGKIYDRDGPLRCCYETKDLYNVNEEMWCDGEQKLVKISDEDKSLGNNACCSVENYRSNKLS